MLQAALDAETAEHLGYEKANGPRFRLAATATAPHPEQCCQGRLGRAGDAAKPERMIRARYPAVPDGRMLAEIRQ